MAQLRADRGDFATKRDETNHLNINDKKDFQGKTASPTDNVSRKYQSIQAGSGESDDEPPVTKVTNDALITGSVMRFRITSVLIPFLFLAGILPFSSLLPEYILHRLATESGLNTSQTKNQVCAGNGSNVTGSQQIQKEASSLLLYFNITESGLSLALFLLVGGFSDIVGRKPFVLLGTLGGFCKLLLSSITIRLELPVWIFYIGHGLSGLCGSWYSIFLGVFAGIADVTEEKHSRVYWIAMIGAFIGIDSVTFMIITGYATDALGFFWASMIGVITTGLAFLVGLFFYPETYKPKEKHDLNYLSSLRRLASFFLFDGPVRTRVSLTLCMCAFFFLIIVMISPAVIDPLYLQKEPFCWTNSYVGLYGGGRMGGQYVSGTVALRILGRYVSVEWIAIVGIILQAISFAFEAFVWESWQFILVPIIGFLGASAAPVVRGVMSSLVSSNDQGALFSTISVIEIVCQLLGTFAILKVYSATLSGSVPGAGYLLIASFDILALILMLIYQSIQGKVKKAGDYEIVVEEE